MRTTGQAQTLQGDVQATNPTRGIALKIASVAVFMAKATCIKAVK